MPHFEDSTRDEKRLKLASGQPELHTQRRTRSKLFSPFRTIGLVSPTAVPFTSTPLGKTTFQITTTIGRSLQTYDLRRGLNLVFLSRPETPSDITATVAWQDKVLVAYGGADQQRPRGIAVYKRGKLLHHLEAPSCIAGSIHRLITLGTWIVALSASTLHVWNSKTLEYHRTIVVRSPTSRAVCTLPTYLNKVFIGRGDGGVDICNVSSGRTVYTIKPRSQDVGRVTALEAAPALSMLAIAYEDGSFVIQDVRSDVEVLTLATGSLKAPTTSIAFRTDALGAGDNGQDAGVMATASSESGDITFWDLHRGGRKRGVLYGAHKPPTTTLDSKQGVDGGISGLEFLAGQAILVSSGMDNALRTWIFDEMPFSAIPRILHSRSGHAAPSTVLKFLPSDFDGADAGGKWLMSASHDRSLWGWSLRRDGQSTELSQGAIRRKAKKVGLLVAGQSIRDQNKGVEDLKAPVINCLACCLNRDGGVGALPGDRNIWNNGKPSDGARKVNKTELSGTTGWESIVTGHADDNIARTWFWGKKRAGRWAFPTGDNGNVTSVAVSPCGSFALIGSSHGGIDMHSLQSGQQRQRFPARLTKQQAQCRVVQMMESVDRARDSSRRYRRGEGKHDGAVTGLLVDNTNRTVVSCGADGKIKFWRFSSGDLLDELDWSASCRILALDLHRSSGLVAFVCSDACVRVVDLSTKRLVRELWGCEDDITACAFSNDGRWLIAASSPLTGSHAPGTPEGAHSVLGASAKNHRTDHRSVVRIWDLPTAHLLDAFRVGGRCNTLAFSGTGEHLAVACDSSVGIDIWINRTLTMHVPTKRLAYDDIADTGADPGHVLHIPRAVGSGVDEPTIPDTERPDEDADDGEEQDADLEVDQLSSKLMTLSVVPKAQWQTLRNLEVIRERNRPTEPPKRPEKAPFFLPSLKDPEQFSKAAKQQDLQTDSSTRRKIPRVDVIVQHASARDEFTRLLRVDPESASIQDYEAVTLHLKSLAPSSTDLAIRTLDSKPPFQEHVVFIRALTSSLRAKKDFELVMVWMGVWLKCHGSLVIEQGDEVEHSTDGVASLAAALRQWHQEARIENARLQALTGLVGGVLGWVRNIG